jgi:hypothetical protein
VNAIRIFTGADKREAVGLHVFMQSVMEKSSLPVSFTPIMENFSALVGGQRDGTNAFTYGRFLVPYLMGWEGTAIFCDGADMLCRTDIAELWNYAHVFENRHNKALLVVQHDYKTTAQRKYIGTEMEAANEDYPRKNWSSLMVMHCGHSAWRYMNPETIDRFGTTYGKSIHRFEFLKPEEIGALPIEWNWLVGEYPHNPDAKIAHFTLGLPGFAHYFGVDYADEWRACHFRSQVGLQPQKITEAKQKLKVSAR